jgi:hypothetical protein
MSISTSLTRSKLRKRRLTGSKKSLERENNRKGYSREDLAKGTKRDMSLFAGIASLSIKLRYPNAHIAAKKPSLMR